MRADEAEEVLVEEAPTAVFTGVGAEEKGADVV